MCAGRDCFDFGCSVETPKMIFIWSQPWSICFLRAIQLQNRRHTLFWGCGFYRKGKVGELGFIYRFKFPLRRHFTSCLARPGHFIGLCGHSFIDLYHNNVVPGLPVRPIAVSAAVSHSFWISHHNCKGTTNFQWVVEPTRPPTTIKLSFKKCEFHRQPVAMWTQIWSNLLT